MTKYIMTTQCEDRIGIVAALTNCLAAHTGFITELAQFGTPKSGRFFSRIEFTMTDQNFDTFCAAVGVLENDLSLNIEIIRKTQKIRTIIMVSKFDHCLADLLYRSRVEALQIDIVAIVSNHPDARIHADMAGIPFHHIPVTKTNKAQAEHSLKAIVKATGAELIILARYMQILSDDICKVYSGRIINIHHSFLPSFKGAKPYHRAYELGVKLIGATAHYVTADLDEGPIIEQSILRVNHTTTTAKLITVGRDVEAQTLAKAVKLHSEYRVFINDNKTVILP